MAIFDEVKELIVSELGASADAVKPEAKIIEDLGADSLDVVELVMALEEKFEISIPDEESAKIATVEDIVNYIENAKK